jgi:hypothetical protein
MPVAAPPSNQGGGKPTNCPTCNLNFTYESNWRMGRPTFTIPYTDGKDGV